jgi:putative membrane-bound dehydrogenase-like protein
MKLRLAACAVLWLVASTLATAQSGQGRGPLTPERERARLKLADDNLIIELVAAEPDVISPVAIAWDEDGRLFVAEMFDYPVGPGFGRVRLLEEPDAAGRFAKNRVFAGKLPFPNSVLPWRGGVLVTAAPDIWYLKDTNKTGRADLRMPVFTGFAPGNQQLRANGLYVGLDNWIYGANGRSGGTIRLPDKGTPFLQPQSSRPSRPVAIDRHDFRFRPETGEFAAIGGFSQFGLAHDDWGRRFPSWNTTPFRHVVVDDRYLNRNRYLPAVSGVADIADPADPNRVFSVSPRPMTFNREPVTFFNASCGNSIYRGDCLAGYRGSLFVCEPLTNLVQRRTLVPRDVTFMARRAEQGREFLAGADPWFHPVNLATGPDGALYVVDFYRKWVEHPDFVPASFRQKHDWREGSGHGRIWRIRPKSWQPPAPPRLSTAATVDLVPLLDHANGWWRDTAQRLLVERQEKSVVAPLAKLARTARLPQGRIHALWTLDGLKSLDEDTLLAALRDPEGQVRRQAVLLAEPRLSASARLRKRAIELAEDSSPEVVFQCALAIGNLRDARAGQTLAAMIARNPADDWLRLAVLSGIEETAWPFLQALVKLRPEWLSRPPTDAMDILREASALVAVGRPSSRMLLNFLAENAKIKPMPGHVVMLAGLAEGCKRSGQDLRTMARSTGNLEGLLQFAHDLSTSAKEPAGLRSLAMALIVETQPEKAAALIPGLLGADAPSAVQAAALRGVGLLNNISLARDIVARWQRLPVKVRGQLIDTLLRSPRLAGVLMAAMEEQVIAPVELSPANREALLRLPDQKLRARAEKLLVKTASNRSDVIRHYQEALRLEGQPRRGAVLFAKHCQACHQVQGQGHRVGADLGGVIGRAKEILLTDILDPNKEVSPDFVNYMVVTKAGQVLSGMIVAETAASIRLRRAEGLEDTVLRSEVLELRSTGKSLMPEGLEQSLSVQEMADLLEFLQRPVQVSR